MTRWAAAPERREQMVLYTRRLEDVLPPGHVARQLDDVLARIDFSPWEVGYDRRGQPAIHPRVLASVLLYGLLTRIRSSRGLEDALQVRLDFRWLAQGHSIDHTTISEFRRKHPEELKDLFADVVMTARRADLVSLQRLAFDGTRVRANNRRTGTRTISQLQEEYDELAAQCEEFMKQAAAEDARDEELFDRGAAVELPVELRDKQHRLAHLKQVLDDLQQAKADGAALPKRVPVTDLDARVMPNKEGGFAPNYTPLATVDVDSGLIVAADVIAEVNEDGHLLPAIAEVQAEFGVLAGEMLADGLNGTGANLAGCKELGVTLYSPCDLPSADNPALRDDPTQPVAEADRSRLPTQKIKSQTQFAKTAFVYDAEQDCYYCPMGQPLEYAHTTREKNGSGERIRRRYKAAASACAECPLRAQCVQGNAAARQINREQHEEVREEHAQRMATDEAQAIYRKRKHPGERPFAVIKHGFGMRRFLLRGLEKVRVEWLWAATAFNLTRLFALLRSGADPPELNPIPPPT